MPQAAPQLDVYKAFHDTVFAYEGGVDLLAAKMGKAAGVLYNKANINESSHNKPTLGEGVQVQAITGDTRITQTMAAVLGGVFVPVQQLREVSDKDLIEIISNWMAEQGRFFTEMNLALADGEVDQVEHAKLRGRAQFILAAVLELVGRLEQMRK